MFSQHSLRFDEALRNQASSNREDGISILDFEPTFWVQCCEC